MAGATEIDASWRNSHADGHYSSRMRTMAWILVVILLFGTGVIGITNGIRELGDSHSGLQLTVTIAVMLYGVFGVAAGIGLARRRPWSVTLSKIWAVAVTYAATVASFAYSDPTFSHSGTITGTIAAALSTALIGAGIVWVARDATRARNLPRATGADHIPSP